MFVLVALVQGSVTVAAAERTERSNVRKLLDARRAQEAIVTVELADGQAVSGSIGRTERTLFYRLDNGNAGPQGRSIAYTDVRAVVDRATGERFEVQVPGPTARLPRVHTSLKAWLIAGLVVGGLIILAYAVLPD
jgi:hypothetical protein